nr:PREDICTED: uncharacterized protein LOC109037579 isoform X2 [Bemisia tabaci]
MLYLSKNICRSPTKLPPSGKDVEANMGADSQPADLFLLKAQRSRALNTLFLLLTALLVTSIGIFSGILVYRQYTQMNRYQRTLYLPREGSSDETLQQLESYYKDRGFLDGLKSWTWGKPPAGDHVQEDFDLDVADGNYEKITVPSFSGGPNTRFIHDFNANMTGIVDFIQQTCYIMPLNRSVIMQPKDLMDAIKHMITGDYTLEPEEIRENWRVVTPALSASEVAAKSELLSNECIEFNTYNLEKIVQGVFKRSLDAADVRQFDEIIGSKKFYFNIHQ